MLQTRTRADASRLTWRVYFTYLLHLLPALPPLGYLVALVAGAPGKPWTGAELAVAAVLLGILGLAGPYAAARMVVASIVLRTPGEKPARTFERTLQAPQRLQWTWSAMIAVGAGVFGALACGWHARGVGAGGWLVLATTLLGLFLTLPVRLHLERHFRPYALELFHARAQPPQGGGLLWPRQRWSLPYAFGLFVATSVLFTGLIAARQVQDTFETLLVQSRTLTPDDFFQLLTAARQQLVQRAWPPVLLIETYLLVHTVLAARALARHQAEGLQAVRASIQGLAMGLSRPPEWLSTDELGDLAFSTARACEQLQSLSRSLAEWGELLGQSAAAFDTNSNTQGTVLTRQAAALQQTQVTAQEIKQTSAVAAQKAELVLQQAQHAEEIRRSGQAAVDQSLDGLQVIRAQVKEMETRIKALDLSARKIATITTTVKDLADRSNMLAINAAIEAVRSGEHGKGFSIVAREIRMLADKSIKATDNVREVLEEITSAIRTTAEITDQGTKKIEDSLELVRVSGTNIGELSVIVSDNASSVKQISAAVTQQNTGIEQIFQSVNELSRMMVETMEGVHASDSAMTTVREVAVKVNGFVSGSRAARPPPTPAPKGQG